MSKLNDLIAELCPHGVELRNFSEVCSLNARIGWHRLTKQEHQTTGDFLLITGTDFTSSYTLDYSRCAYVSEERYLQDPKIQLKNEDILITKDGTLGKVAQVKNLPKPATLNSGVFVVRSLDGSLNHRYILHYLVSKHFSSVVNQRKTGSTISHLTQELFSNLKIPVPPLEVQREIVRILDTFTELTAELTAELVARKQQYEYYRDLLLTFDKTPTELSWHRRVEFKKLGEVAEIGTGNSNTENEIVNGIYPFFVRSPIVRRKNNFDFDETAIITSGDGVGVGKIFHYVEGKYALHQRAYRIHITDEKVLPKFFYHYMSAKFYDYLKRVVFNSSVTSIRKQMLEKFPVPTPSLEEQERIVKILDRFDKLCNDLSEGLPAEIESRKQQYEFYRDKLLSFDKDWR